MTKTEKLAQKILLDQGFLVESVIKTQWHRNDFFNLWDFIAVSTKEIKFIQVSTMKIYQGSHYGKDFKGFPVPPCAKKEYWLWDKKNKRFIIKELIPDKK